MPDDTVCVIGTTSDRVPFETVDDLKITQEEVDILERGAIDLAPACASTRVIRAYCGVRPLVAADNDRRAGPSAAASCCSTTPHETVWRDSSPSRVAR